MSATSSQDQVASAAAHGPRRQRRRRWLVMILKLLSMVSAAAFLLTPARCSMMAVSARRRYDVRGELRVPIAIQVGESKAHQANEYERGRQLSDYVTTHETGASQGQLARQRLGNKWLYGAEATQAQPEAQTATPRTRSDTTTKTTIESERVPPKAALAHLPQGKCFLIDFERMRTLFRLVLFASMAAHGRVDS